jgi:hypothetical protein
MIDSVNRDEHGINAAEGFAPAKMGKSSQSNNADSLKRVDGKQGAILGR